MIKYLFIRIYKCNSGGSEFCITVECRSLRIHRCDGLNEYISSD